MNQLDRYRRRVVITGGAGFIGSNLLRFMVPKYRDYLFVNIDCLTYAGNLANLKETENKENYIFEKIDIRDYERLKSCFDKYDVNAVIHLAAESHVDRSILTPEVFIDTNIKGTFNLLELARRKGGDFRFHHVSTDEVFGSIDDGYFTENSAYNPSSPYAASKASADHLVRAYHRTYQLDTVISNCTNNFGPYQFPEKLIPLVIRNGMKNEVIPIYGDGANVRSWIYVEDHCRALDMIFHRGKSGETYNIPGSEELSNTELVGRICRILDKILGGGPRENLISYVGDRPGHDKRYALEGTAIESEIGWESACTFNQALERTIQWYLENQQWLDDCITGEYLNYYEKNYLKRQP
ncbi:MAG: dTDP-glucose 4,6-dehydratase [Candidatus Zixiibacteriota bacterium]